MDTTPAHFHDEEIQVEFDQLPAREKSPPCPNGFTWRGKTYRVSSVLSEWVNFERRGRMEANMQPAHANRAAIKGSWGVGRFFFRILVEDGRIFDIYYDRAPDSVSDRKGHWVLLAERETGAVQKS
jgi:hypothetical protein